MKECDDKKVLCVWGTYFILIVMDCSATALILILQYKYGGGGRIWTFDLSAYNFYWLSSRALTNWIYSQIALTSTSDIMEYLAHGISLFNCRLSGVCPARKARAKSSNVQFPRLPPSVMFGPWGPFEAGELPAKFSPWQEPQDVMLNRY